MGGAGSVNPDTGLPEYKPSWKRVIRVAAVVVSIVYPPAAIAVGEFLGFTGVAAGAAGAATISAGTVLATGGTPEQALKAGVASAAGAGVGGATAAELGAVGSAAAGGATSGGASVALAGGDAQDILKGAAKGAVISGGAAGITELAKAATTPSVDYSIAPKSQYGGEPGIKATMGEGTQLFSDTQPGGLGIQAVPSLSGYGLSQSTQYGGEPGIKGEPSTEIPTYKSSLSPEAQRAISGAAGAGLNYLLTQPVPGAPSVGADSGGGAVSPAVSGISSSGATTGLTGARGAGEIESKQTGKPRQDVWNESSLRLKDALGV